MRIACIDGKDIYGTGGALRGHEMSYALTLLGHELIQRPDWIAAADLLARQPPIDALILTGTWHQLMNGGRNIIELSSRCAERKIPALWWYGSNGSVFGCADPDPKKRAASEREIIRKICDRSFIGVICPYSMDIYERHGVPRSKMRLVPSVFDGDLFCPESSSYDRRMSERLRFKFSIPESAFCMGTVGHCPNSKGADETIEAMALLMNEMPDLHYLILHSPETSLNRNKACNPQGDPVGLSEWDVVQQTHATARRLGLQNRVHFLPTRWPREAMPAFYRLLRIYCSPSKAENLGQPLVESQLIGLPLVTYQGFSFDYVSCPFTAQQFPPHHTETDDYGLVIPFADPAVLAEAIRRARHVAETPASADLTRNWTYNRFGHRNAQAMVDALIEYRERL